MRSLTYAELLRGNKYFRWLLIGQSVSELGSWFNYVAGMGLVRSISGASVEAAGILLLLRTLPFALLMPIAGTLADRISRRTLMLVTDAARALCVLIFLLVDGPEDVWLVYLGAILVSTFTAFFEAAKNSTFPNLVGAEGLLPGNALMFTPRFLLMAVGAALGGIASDLLGYKAAFIINAITYAISTYAVWLIPEEVTRQKGAELDRENRAGFFADAAAGMKFAYNNRLTLSIILLNICWAIGGGASTIIAERLGGIVFAAREGWTADAGFSILLTAAGAGLFIGMIMSRRVGTFVEDNNLTYHFIGWAVVIHGLLYALGGLMPTLWLVAFVFLLSRAIIGSEYGLQETLLQRSIPDKMRGRVLTLDRGAEITVFSLSGFVGAYAMNWISPEMLTVIAGIFAGSSGLVWFWRERHGRAAIESIMEETK